MLPPITCLKLIIGTIVLLMLLVVFVYRWKVKRDKLKEIEKIPDDEIDWELNLN